MIEDQVSKKDGKVFMTRKLFIILDEFDRPVNKWDIFIKDSGDIQTFPTEESAERHIKNATHKRLHSYRHTRIVPAWVSWEREADFFGKSEKK